MTFAPSTPSPPVNSVQRSLTKSAAGLTPLAVGAVAGAGAVSAAPQLAAGMRRAVQPHLEAAALANTAKRVGGPLGTVADLGPNQFDFRTQADRLKFGSALPLPVFLESRMRSPVPDDVYVAAAHGVLSDREVAHIESFGEELSKGASFGQAFQYGLGTAAASAVGGLAMIGMSHGIQSAYDSLTFEKDLQATLKTRPELSTYPKEQVRLVYQSLRRLSPELAKDPLTAGTYLARQFGRRDSNDPHAIPMVELETASTLSRVSGEYGKRRDNVRDALLQANAQGTQAAVGYMQEMRQAKRQDDSDVRRFGAGMDLEREKSRLRDLTEQGKEQRNDTREQARRMADAKKRLADQAHERQMADRKYDEQQSVGMHRFDAAEQRAAAAEDRLRRMETSSENDIRSILRPLPSVETALRYTPPPPPSAPTARDALATMAAQMRAAGPRPPGPRNGKKRK